MKDELAASYHYCSGVARDSGSNFYRSFSLLEPQRKRAMEALYAFARWTDDLSDQAGESQDKATRLCAWQAELESRYHARVGTESGRQGLVEFQDNQLWPALIDSVHRYRIPLQILLDLVAGVQLDVDSVRIETRSELERYCYCVAGTIGIACLHIWEGPVERLRSAAIDCGFAFQVTNILRDVMEDARRQRIYLPQADLLEFQCDPLSWIAERPTGDWQGLIRRYIQEAAAAYEKSWEIHAHLPPDAKKMFSLMWQSYHAILDEIAKQPELIWQRRLSVPLWKKAKLFFTHFGPLS